MTKKEDAMASSENLFSLAAYYSLWSQSIASTMSPFIGKEIGAAAKNEAIDDSGDDRLWVTFTLSEALLGEQTFSASRADALHLSQLFIGETPDPNAEFTADHADAFAELFRQFSGTVALQLKGLLGEEIAVRFKDTQVPVWGSAESTSLIVKTEPSIIISSRMDTGLLDTITKAKLAAAEIEPEQAETQVSAPTQRPGAEAETEEPVMAHSAAPTSNSARASINDKNLDLLLDVKLEVSIRFGRRQMMLRDVLDLSSGVMVEIDRRVRDPIELLLEGRVIARGEAVIVDGNYGIRITEVVSPSQRLAEIA
ncbi:MAG TPA: flagellar motor switch protein FliN [Candidatus Angelobacter sp.]|nr:flagellar motor switch protein FliN [Candidatus Angelobacter sp.]